MHNWPSVVRVRGRFGRQGCRCPIPSHLDTMKKGKKIHTADVLPYVLHSPTKSEFIRSKYQMLSFVHKLPCRDDDGVTTKDLSKVRPAPSGQVSEVDVLHRLGSSTQGQGWWAGVPPTEATHTHTEPAFLLLSPVGRKEAP